MTHEGLDAALAAAAVEGSSLRMVAFSHLDLGDWRKEVAYVLPQSAAGSPREDFDLGLRVQLQPLVRAPSVGCLQVQHLTLLRDPCKRGKSHAQSMMGLFIGGAARCSH